MRVTRLFGTFAACVLAILFAVEPSAAQKRVALVIGNSAYKNASKLANPTNDAKAIAGMLQYAGFDAVELFENLGVRELRQAIGDFADIARDADTAVVYYSGHGIEVNGINYLIPIDAVLNRDIDVPFETYSLESLVQVLEPARRLRLVMLDACRDNPFVKTMKRTAGTRAVGRGLAAVEPTSVNTLIGFAAKAGSFALDGDGANSPYAAALLNNLPTPGLDLRIAFGRVRDEVLKTTRNKQEPFVYGSLGGGTVSIVDAPATSTGTPPQTSSPNSHFDRADRAWAATKDTASIAILEDFIKQFGSTPYGSMARARLEELKKSQVPVTPPPQVSSVPPPHNNAAERAWATTKDTTSIAVLEDFIRQFGSTPYGSMARARLEELKKSQVAIVVPKPLNKLELSSPSNPPGSTLSVSGKWRWQSKCKDGSEWKGGFDFVQDSNGTVSGSMFWDGGSGTVSGKLIGNRFAFTRTVIVHNQPWTATILENGKKMQGSISEPMHGDCTFQAYR